MKNKREEFKAHKLEDIVSVTHRDVCVDGFGLENVADASFFFFFVTSFFIFLKK